MRLRHELLVHVSRDTDGNDTHFQRREVISRVIVDSYAKHQSGDFDVPEGTQVALSLGDVAAAKGLYFEADGDCDVYLNGSADPIQVRKAPAFSETAAPSYAKLFLECDLTSITVDANQGSDVTGVYVVWGDVAS